MNMITSIISASLISKTELAEALGFDSRSTLYARLEDPNTFTIGEVEIIARKLNLPINKITAILLGNEVIYSETIKKIIKKNG